jgi:hypothetical protein
MKFYRLASVLGLTLASSVAGWGCDEEEVPPVGEDPIPVDSPDAAAEPDPVPVPSPDAAVDGPTPPDAPPDPPAPPDTAPPISSSDGPAVATSCPTACPGLFSVTSQCDVGEQACTVAMPVDTDDMKVRNICYTGGIKKTATETYPTGTSYLVSLAVKKADGSACYTIDVSGEDGAPETSWLFRTPGGQELGRVIVTDTSTTLTCQASAAVFDISQADDCAGLEGEDECTAGACAP